MNIIICNDKIKIHVSRFLIGNLIKACTMYLNWNWKYLGITGKRWDRIGNLKLYNIEKIIGIKLLCIL